MKLKINYYNKNITLARAPRSCSVSKQAHCIAVGSFIYNMERFC